MSAGTSSEVDVKSKQKSEVKRIAGTLGRLYAELDRRCADSARPGFVANRWGSFWPSELIDSWLTANLELCEIDDENERLAGMVSRAAFLLNLNRLDESENWYKRLAAVRPYANALKGLAIIQARRGNVVEARRLADIANAAPHGNVFRTTEDELAEEVAVGKRFST